jgi:hypothetical protein
MFLFHLKFFLLIDNLGEKHEKNHSVFTGGGGTFSLYIARDGRKRENSGER